MSLGTAAHEGINTYNEKSLHLELKEWYSQPGDLFEQKVDGFIIDIVRGQVLIEVQTRNFSAMKRKLNQLVLDHPVHLVFPIAEKKWIVKRPVKSYEKPSRRKSPKEGDIFQLFDELVSIPHLLALPGFSLEVLFIHEEEVRRYRGRRGWRRKEWVTDERRLLEVVRSRRFHSPADFLALLPGELPSPFSTADLSEGLSIPRVQARKIAFCLRQMNAIQPVGKRGNAILYKVAGN